MAKKRPIFSFPELEHRGRNAYIAQLRPRCRLKSRCCRVRQRRPTPESACWRSTHFPARGIPAASPACDETFRRP